MKLQRPQEKNGERVAARVWFRVLAYSGIAALLVILLLPVVNSFRDTSHPRFCGNNLRQISLALACYEQAYRALPPSYTVDVDGRPLHSWRTLILPYLEEQHVYNSIDMSKPWDDPANAEAFKTEISVYRCPEANRLPNNTNYLAVVAPGGCFRLTEPRHISEITDGTSQTLMVIEVPSQQSVPWMSPNDANEQVVMGLGPDSQMVHTGGTNASFVDGSVRFLKVDLPASLRRAMISVAGNDSIAGDDN